MTRSVSVSKGDRLADSDDGAVTQDNNRLNGFVICRKGGGQAGALSVESAPWSSVPASVTPVCLRFVMSLQLISLFTAHPAKLINLLALLFACPGGWLLHATRRREQRAMASIEAQRQSRPSEE